MPYPNFIFALLLSFLAGSCTTNSRITVPCKKLQVSLNEKYESIQEKNTLGDFDPPENGIRITGLEIKPEDWELRFEHNGVPCTFSLIFDPFMKFDTLQRLVGVDLFWAGPDWSGPNTAYATSKEIIQKSVALISGQQIDLQKRFDIPDDYDIPLVLEKKRKRYFEKLILSKGYIIYQIGLNGLGLEHVYDDCAKRDTL